MQSEHLEIDQGCEVTKIQYREAVVSTGQIERIAFRETEKVDSVVSSESK